LPQAPLPSKIIWPVELRGPDPAALKRKSSEDTLSVNDISDLQIDDMGNTSVLEAKRVPTYERDTWEGIRKTREVDVNISKRNSEKISDLAKADHKLGETEEIETVRP